MLQKTFTHLKSKVNMVITRMFENDKSYNISAETTMGIINRNKCDICGKKLNSDIGASLMSGTIIVCYKHLDSIKKIFNRIAESPDNHQIDNLLIECLDSSSSISSGFCSNCKEYDNDTIFAVKKELNRMEILYCRSCFKTDVLWDEDIKEEAMSKLVSREI